MAESDANVERNVRQALTPRERWRRKRLAQERWKCGHREAYLAQKRELAARPEYLAKRRARYAQNKAASSNGDAEQPATC